MADDEKTFDLPERAVLPSEATPERAAGRELELLTVALTSLLTGYILIPAIGAMLLKTESWAYNLFAAAGPQGSVIMLLTIMRSRCGSWRELASLLYLERFPWRLLGLVLTLALLLMAVGGMITALWQLVLNRLHMPFAVPPLNELALSGNICQIVMLAVTALLAAPFFEEVLFRRALYGVLQNFLPGKWALIVTALGFSLLHLSLLQLPGLFFLACVWQICVRRSNSLWISIILHFFNNALAVVLLFLARSLGCAA